MTYVATDLSGPVEPRRAEEQPLPRTRAPQGSEPSMIVGNPALNRVNSGSTRTDKTLFRVGSAPAALLIIGGSTWFATHRGQPEQAPAPVAAAPAVSESTAATPLIAPVKPAVVARTPDAAPAPVRTARVTPPARTAAPVARSAPSRAAPVNQPDFTAQLNARSAASANTAVTPPTAAPAEASSLSTFKLTPPAPEAAPTTVTPAPAATPAEAPQA
ncbi:hypothetical protein BH09PSE2_BH09PSE2_11290 [soil metagenome]